MQIKWPDFCKGEMSDMFIQDRPNFLNEKKKKDLSERNFIKYNDLVWLELKRLNLFLGKKKVIRDVKMSQRPVLRH